MTYQGLDPVAVRAAATSLRGRADELDHLLGAVGHLVDQAVHEWTGQDVLAFSHTWTGKLRGDGLAVVEGLRGLAQAAENNVAEQEKASGGGGASAIINATHHAMDQVRRTVGAWSTTGPERQITNQHAVDYARAAYGGSLPDGSRDLTDAELRAAGIDPALLHKANGLDARVTIDEDGHVVLAFAGSVDAAGDWVGSNGRSAASTLGVSLRTGQVEDAIDLGMALKQKYGADGFTVVGHSLGGREAAVVSVATGARAVTFNAATPTDEDLLYAQERAGHHVNLAQFAGSKLLPGTNLRPHLEAGQITNYVGAHDPLTGLQRLNKALGDQVTVDAPGSVDARYNHALERFDGKV